MSKKLKDIILSSIVVLAGIMAIVGLTTALVSAMETGVNAFDFLDGWVEGMGEDGTFMFIKIAIIATIVCGALAIVAGLASIFVKKDSLKVGGLVIAAIGAILNLVAGILYLSKMNDLYGAYVEYSTTAFVGLILVAVLAIAFVVVKKLIKDKE